MKCFLSSLLVITAVLTSFTRAQEKPATLEPVVVVAINSYQGLLSDLDYLGKEIKEDFLLKRLSLLIDKIFQGKDFAIEGLTALDQTKPCGFILGTDGASMVPLLLLPTSDPEKLFEQLKPLMGGAKKNDAGLYEIEKPIFGAIAKAQDGWLYLAQSAAHLALLPDAAKVLGDAAQGRDLTMQLNVQKVPEQIRELFVDQLRVSIEAAEAQKPDETDAYFAFRKEVGHLRSQLIDRAFTSSEQMTFGFTIANADPGKDARGKFELLLKPVANSPLAGHLSELRDLKTRFGGLLVTDEKIKPALILNMTGPLDKDMLADYVKQVDTYRDAALDLVQRSTEARNDEERAILKELATSTTDVIRGTIEAGRLDVAVRMLDKPKKSLVMAARVAKPEDLKKVFDRIGELAEGDPGFAEVKLNEAEHNGTAIHGFTLKPTKGSQLEAVAKFFEKPKLLVAVKDDNLYVAIGPAGVDLIKQAIDGPEVAVTPMQAKMRLVPLIQLVGQMLQQQELKVAISLIGAQLVKFDAATVTAEVTPEGNLQVVGDTEKGAVKLLGTVFGTFGTMVYDLMRGQQPLGLGT